MVPVLVLVLRALVASTPVGLCVWSASRSRRRLCSLDVARPPWQAFFRSSTGEKEKTRTHETVPFRLEPGGPTLATTTVRIMTMNN